MWIYYPACAIIIYEVDTMNNLKKRGSNSIPRIAFVALAVMLQVGWLMLQILKLNRYSVYISLVTSILSAVVVLKLYSNHTNAAMKMPWILLIVAFPVMGFSLYLIAGLFGDRGSTAKRIDRVRKKTQPLLQRGEPKLQDSAAANQFRYLQNHNGSPAYGNTRVDYFPEGKQALEAMKADLERAEEFIFMEYFIVEDGSAFRELREILERKVAEGVQVRLLYDDIGSVGYVNMRFARSLNEKGIRCLIFNPARPTVNLFMNNRDHRKITVIDGKVGYTGGYNLADEYFDRSHPYGHWKDTGIRLEGEAVQSLTATFLELWYVASRQEEDYGKFLQIRHSVEAPGVAAPFGDNPLGRERAAENVCLNLAAQAKSRLWICTPYLILSDEMIRALGLAAKRGVDVRILTPGIPDKKTVYQVTRSYFAGLADQGVRIFSYTPGFCHAKMWLCDGELASIGTSNLDYRSFYHHFENNVLLYGCPAVAQMEKDFENTFLVSREVTAQYRSGRGAILLLWQCLLRLFAPLM